MGDWALLIAFVKRPDNVMITGPCPHWQIVSRSPFVGLNSTLRRMAPSATTSAISASAAAWARYRLPAARPRFPALPPGAHSQVFEAFWAGCSNRANPSSLTFCSPWIWWADSALR